MTRQARQDRHQAGTVVNPGSRGASSTCEHGPTLHRRPLAGQGKPPVCGAALKSLLTALPSADCASITLILIQDCVPSASDNPSDDLVGAQLDRSERINLGSMSESRQGHGPDQVGRQFAVPVPRALPHAKSYYTKYGVATEPTCNQQISDQN
jgi:hypothetical protein